MDSKRDMIKTNATILFASKGIKNTSMRDIAASLNSAVGGLYYHYPSKERLLQEILEESIWNRRKFMEKLEKESLTFEEKIRLLLRRRLKLEKERYSLYLFAKILENGETNLTFEEYQKDDVLFKNLLNANLEKVKEEFHKDIDKIGKVLSASFTRWLLLLIEETKVNVVDIESYNRMVDVFNRKVDVEREIETFYKFSIESLLKKD